MTPGDKSAILYGPIRPRRRDRYGEVIDEPEIHGTTCPPIEREDRRFSDYCVALRREEQSCKDLSITDLEARADAARSELVRRGAA